MIQDGYMRAVDSSGLMNSLTPAELASVDGRQRSRGAIAKVDAALNIYKTQMDEYYEDLPRLPEKYGVTSKNADLYRQGIVTGMNKTKPKAERVLQLERVILDLARETITFVETRPIPAESDGENMLFVYDYEIDEYNRLIEELQARATEQTKLQQEMLQAMRENSQTIREAAE
jgi:hypothetical protein